MTCAPAYGLGTSKKKKKKTLRRLWLVPRPMAWAQVKKTPTQIMTRAHGLWPGHE